MSRAAMLDRTMGKILDESTVRHVAGLARLRLTDDEVVQFARELSDILAYVEQLNELDTSEVPPTGHPLDVRNVLREDEARASWTSDAATANAPAREGGFFQVPTALDQERA